MADAMLWRTQAAGVEWYLEFFPNGVKSVCLAYLDFVSSALDSDSAHASRRCAVRRGAWCVVWWLPVRHGAQEDMASCYINLRTPPHEHPPETNLHFTVHCLALLLTCEGQL